MEVDAVLNSVAENLRERTRPGSPWTSWPSDRPVHRPPVADRVGRPPALGGRADLTGPGPRGLDGRLLGEGQEGPAIAVYSGGEPTHEAAGLTVANCGGFPGSATIEALHITIEPDRSPAPSRHRGEEWVYVLSGCLRLEFDGEVHLLEPGSSAHFDAERPHRLGAVGVTTEVLVVAADAPVESTSRSSAPRSPPTKEEPKEPR